MLIKLSDDQKCYLGMACQNLILKAHLNEMNNITDEETRQVYANLHHYASDFIINYSTFLMNKPEITENYVLIIRKQGIEFYPKSHERIQFWKDTKGVLAIYEIDMPKLSYVNQHNCNCDNLYEEDSEFYCIKKIESKDL